MSTLDGRDARRARVAVSALFLVNGALMANVLPRLPAIKSELDLTNAALGTAVAAMPVGGLLAGAAAGMLIVRDTSRRVTVATGVAFGLLLGSIGLAPGWLALAAAFLVLGMVDALMDSAMNAHGIAVQRCYGRSIMHGFHGWWSAGTLLGAGTGAIAAALDVPLDLHLAVVGLLLAGASLGALPLLLADRDVDVAARRRRRAASRGVGRRFRACVSAGVGALAGSPRPIGPISAGTWAAVPLAATGFTLVGLGTSPLFPVMISAAGTVPGVPAGQGVAVVAWLARGGFVVAPTLVGLAADAVGLGVALVIPLVAGVTVAILMGTLLAASGRRARLTPREAMLDA